MAYGYSSSSCSPLGWCDDDDTVGNHHHRRRRQYHSFARRMIGRMILLFGRMVYTSRKAVDVLRLADAVGSFFSGLRCC